MPSVTLHPRQDVLDSVQAAHLNPGNFSGLEVTMRAKHRTTKKKPTDTYETLAAKVTDYKLRIRAGLNSNLKGNPIRQPRPTDPLYTYETWIQIYVECTEPSKRAGETYDIFMVADPNADDLKLTLDDVQARDRAGNPKTRFYRGAEITVYEPPPGITVVSPGGGKRHHHVYLRVAPSLASNMITALSADAAPFLAIHEHKVGPKRWIDHLSLQSVDPAEE